MFVGKSARRLRLEQRKKLLIIDDKLMVLVISL